MPESISFGTWLRQKRRALDLTQKALADRVGCAEITVRRMEADEYRPSIELALVVLEKLRIPEAERTQWVRFARGLAEHPNNQTPSQIREQKTNLPISLTSFIGHEKDIERIQQRLIGHRLVTLIGVGGIGKTRLSQQVANQLLSNYPNGVWLVELASLNNAALIPQSVAAVFGIQQGADHSGLVEKLIHFLQTKTLLLILDNCEHLLDACAGLADKLLKSCPNLKILATSREALGIIGEAVYQVPSLTIPEVPRIETIGKLNDYESIRLFTERAQLVQMDFALTKENASSVIQICSRLDGIPLAIELAAVRIQTLSTEQIAKQLDQCFHVLTGGSSTALPKHQTLQACIDWSWQLLDASEQTVLGRLSVFAGGWTLEAANAVCVANGVEAGDVLDLMTQLANKSLILAEREQGQEARYRMLETIRQYASERLLEAADSEQVRKRHFEFFLQHAEQVEPELRGPHQVEWLDELETEHDNLRAALEWSLMRAEHGEASLRLASALLLFWNRRGHRSEGRSWLNRALSSQVPPIANAVRGKALHAAGYLAHHQGDVTIARALLEESVGLWRALGSTGQTGLAHALATLAETMRWLGDPATARSLASEAIALCRTQGEHWGLAYSLSSLGLALRDQEDFALAHSTLHEGIALWRDVGDLWGLRLATDNLGEVAMRQGDYQEAQRYYGEGLVLARQLGDRESAIWSLLNLGIVTLNLGDRNRAKAFFEEGFGLFRELGSKQGQAICLYYFGYLAQFEGDNQAAMTFFKQELALARTTGPLWLGAQALFGLAAVAAARGQASRAARLFGAAEARLEAGASYVDAADRRLNERTVAKAVAQLGEAEFADSRAEGRAMTFEQAADYALEEN